MKTFILLTAIFLVAAMVTSSPIHVTSLKHYVQRISSAISDGSPPVRSRPKPAGPYTVRKGEYECGDRICALTPGVVPKGCNRLCQYPI